jgi:hypothetical protein
MKIRIVDLYYSRLEQIEVQLRQQYYKGKRRNNLRIGKLIKEKRTCNLGQINYNWRLHRCN